MYSGALFLTIPILKHHRLPSALGGNEGTDPHNGRPNIILLVLSGGRGGVEG